MEPVTRVEYIKTSIVVTPKSSIISFSFCKQKTRVTAKKASDWKIINYAIDRGDTGELHRKRLTAKFIRNWVWDLARRNLIIRWSTPSNEKYVRCFAQVSQWNFRPRR